MKIDYDKKHPLTSVELIAEDENDEYLTEEQTAEFRKIGLRCVRISYLCAFFAVTSLVCEVADIADIFSASGVERIIPIIGYSGLACLIVSIACLFAEGRKLSKTEERFERENQKTT